MVQRTIRMVNAILILTILISILSCNAQNPNQQTTDQTSDKKESSGSHLFMNGEWVETEDLNRLKKGDLKEPHPFQNGMTTIGTCQPNGAFFFTNLATSEGKPTRKGNDYISHEKFSTGNTIKYKLHFNTNYEDTTLVFESQFDDKPVQSYHLTKAPNAVPCKHSVGPKAIQDVYNHYFFDGDYTVENIVKKTEYKVNLHAGKMSGIPKVPYFSIANGGSMLLAIFASEDYKTITRMALVQKEYGFDLLESDYTAKHSLKNKKIKSGKVLYKFKKIK